MKNWKYIYFNFIFNEWIQINKKYIVCYEYVTKRICSCVMREIKNS